jgi:hypothetical protein
MNSLEGFMLRIYTSATFAAFFLTASSALAQPPAPDIKALMTPDVLANVHKWVETDIVRASIEAQNKRLGNLPQDQINTLDQQWVRERKQDDKPLISATLSVPLSVYLSRVQARSLGLYAEIFVMDHNGLNVGQSSVTSDFWQGDETKFQKTYDVGPDAVFIDEPEWDDDFKVWRGQVSFTVNDASKKTKIGAVTVEFNLTELQRRSGGQS